MAKSRLENKWDAQETNAIPYYLDLIAYRSISDQVAQQFEVHHQSPQILMIRNGKCHYDTSHMDISFDAVKEAELSSQK
jgi:bacillithiol system protein YtxJ